MVLALVRQADVRLASSAAEDVCQEVFMALAQGAGRFREGANVRAYVAGIAVRKAREHRRNTWFRRNVLERVGRLVSGDSARVDEQVGAALEGERLLTALPAPFREVVVLHVVEGLGAEAISQALGISVNTVWTRLHRARALMAALSKAGER